MVYKMLSKLRTRTTTRRQEHCICCTLLVKLPLVHVGLFLNYIV